MTIDAASQVEGFRNHVFKVRGAEIIAEMVAESIRIGGSTYNPETRTVTVEGLRVRIGSDGFIRLC